MTESINITIIERLKAAKVIRKLARDKGLSVLQARSLIWHGIEEAWGKASMPDNQKARTKWQQLFPLSRKPTVDEYIVTIAREMTAGKNPPYLFD